MTDKLNYEITVEPDAQDFDIRTPSQNPYKTLIFWAAFQKHIESSDTLTKLCINDQRIDPRSWTKLATAISKSRTMLTLQISGCNLATANCARLFCAGLRENDRIKYLDLSCNELKDEHGKLIVDTVRTLAERRDHL